MADKKSIVQIDTRDDFHTLRGDEKSYFEVADDGNLWVYSENRKSVYHSHIWQSAEIITDDADNVDAYFAKIDKNEKAA